MASGFAECTSSVHTVGLEGCQNDSTADKICCVNTELVEHAGPVHCCAVAVQLQDVLLSAKAVWGQEAVIARAQQP